MAKVPRGRGRGSAFGWFYSKEEAAAVDRIPSLHIDDTLFFYLCFMANPGSVILPSLILSFTPPQSPSTDHDPNSDPSPDQEPATDRLLFDFQKFLEGGALDDVFEAPTGPTGKPTLPDATPDDRRWEVTKLSGGWINITVRVFPRREDEKLGKDPKSVVIKYAPPFVARIGESVPFGTFRQVST